MSESLSTVIEQVRHPDRNVRANAALALGKEADASAAVRLVPTLSQEPALIDVYSTVTLFAKFLG